MMVEMLLVSPLDKLAKAFAKSSCDMKAICPPLMALAAMPINLNARCNAKLRRIDAKKILANHFPRQSFVQASLLIVKFVFIFLP